MVDPEFIDSSIERFFFQLNFSTGFSSNVSELGRLYFISIFFTAMNQLWLVNDLTSGCLLAYWYSTESCDNLVIFPYKDSILLCIMASAGRVPDRIYTAGSSVVVDIDNSCFNSFYIGFQALLMIFLLV